ncbi:Protein of unknown function [Lactobacillus delbrueckii subsp. bulgaricus]|nr:Protein of unknown function [Lactobacillus delbrueckii subsp. bulgaricus]
MDPTQLYEIYTHVTQEGRKKR